MARLKQHKRFIRSGSGDEQRDTSTESEWESAPSPVEGDARSQINYSQFQEDCDTCKGKIGYTDVEGHYTGKCAHCRASGKNGVD